MENKPPQLITKEDLCHHKIFAIADRIRVSLGQKDMAKAINTILASKLEYKKCKIYKGTPVDSSHSEEHQRCLSAFSSIIQIVISK